MSGESPRLHIYKQCNDNFSLCFTKRVDLSQCTGCRKGYNISSLWRSCLGYCWTRQTLTWKVTQNSWIVQSVVSLQTTMWQKDVFSLKMHSATTHMLNWYHSKESRFVAPTYLCFHVLQWKYICRLYNTKLSHNDIERCTAYAIFHDLTINNGQ